MIKMFTLRRKNGIFQALWDVRGFQKWGWSPFSRSGRHPPYRVPGRRPPSPWSKPIFQRNAKLPRTSFYYYIYRIYEWIPLKKFWKTRWVWEKDCWFLGSWAKFQRYSKILGRRCLCYDQKSILSDLWIFWVQTERSQGIIASGTWGFWPLGRFFGLHCHKFGFCNVFNNWGYSMEWGNWDMSRESFSRNVSFESSSPMYFAASSSRELLWWKF